MKFYATEDQVEVLGRTLFIDNTRYLGHACSGITFEVVAKKVMVRLWTDGESMDKEEHACVAVFKGEEEVPIKRLRLDQEEADYCLFESDKQERVKLSLIKYSEDAFAAVGIKYVAIDGELLPKNKGKVKRKLLFIGDSITCGYGIEGICEKDVFTTQQENPWEAYAATVSRSLQCDYHIVARSSIGVYSSWSETGTMNNEILMPKLYPYTDFELMRRYGKPFDEIWHVEQFQPDVVVINLGTNDLSYTQGKNERVEGFGRAYKGFLEKIREDYPKAHILCTLGVMGDALYPEIEKQVSYFQEEKRDKNISALLLDKQKEEDGLGTYWHPSKVTHKKMAKVLCTAIQRQLNW